MTWFDGVSELIESDGAPGDALVVRRFERGRPAVAVRVGRGPYGDPAYVEDTSYAGAPGAATDHHGGYWH
jgi:hypothetical protein